MYIVLTPFDVRYNSCFAVDVIYKQFTKLLMASRTIVFLDFMILQEEAVINTASYLDRFCHN